MSACPARVVGGSLHDPFAEWLAATDAPILVARRRRNRWAKVGGHLLAGFQVIVIGRFWVTTEVNDGSTANACRK